jgi:hypothetical protein
MCDSNRRRIRPGKRVCTAHLRILKTMLIKSSVRRRFFAIAIACVIATACSHSTSSDDSTGAGAQASGGAIGSAPQRAASTARPDHPSDGYRLAEIAVARLGGSRAPLAPRVTGVSVVENYGLTVYDIGNSTQELLLIKERGQWRPLGSDAFVANGRGIVHFGLDPELANRLIEELTPPPSQ